MIVVDAGLALAGCGLGDQSVQLGRCVFDSPARTLDKSPNESTRLEDGTITFTDVNGNTFSHVSYADGVLTCVEDPED